jgi:hypothetical protein
MKRSLNNKGRIILNFKLIALCFMLCTGILLLWMLYPENASSGPYLNSAHGNTGYGVKRDAAAFPADYTRGLCAHCHEQHAKIGGSEPAPTGGPDIYLLLERNFNTYRNEKPYYQHDNVCFYCHVDTVTGTYQDPPFSNYTYSATFGGCPTTSTYCPTATIFEAFNITPQLLTLLTSYHNLNDVLNFAKSKWSSTFTANSNPCSACHNVHIVKRSCNKPPLTNSYDPTKSAISKPSDHGNLWGDDSPGERMTKPAYGTGYQPPYYYNSTSLEPDGASSVIAIQAEKTPDYVTFCTDCHNASNTINSTTLGGRTLHTINWANEMHGGYAADYCSAYDHPPPPPPIVPQTLRSLLAPPYDGLTRCGQYVLACTDCHEPHGSPNNFLVRKQVNKGIVEVTENGAGVGPDGRTNKEWVNLCGKCHTGLLWGDLLIPHHDADTGLECAVCHTGYVEGQVQPVAYRACSDCHFHGNKVITGTGWNKPLF